MDPTPTPTDLPNGTDEWSRWMRRALVAAERAAAEGEVPVGALVVRAGELLGEGWNRTEQLNDPTAHAEIVALKRATARARNHRLPGAVLISTLEPCLMCFGALLESRISVLVFGAADPLRGAVPLWKSGALSSYPGKELVVVAGIAEEECSARLKRWFAARRSEAADARDGVRIEEDSRRRGA
jgi:tRNA(adenine34) deaminase